MQKKKKWQFILIVAVAALTIYNILPTVFYYTKPLHSPVNEPRANAVSLQIASRINSLEPQSLEWAKSFCRLLQIKPLDIKLDSNTQLISVSCQTSQDANRLKKFLPRAGALIPFTPAQLSLYGNGSGVDDKVVQIQRNIAVHFDPNQVNSFFQFSEKLNGQGQVTPLYEALVTDRLIQLALCLGGTSQNGELADTLLNSTDSSLNLELSAMLADRIVSFVQAFGNHPSVSKRFFASFAKTPEKQVGSSLAAKIEAAMAGITKEINDLTLDEATAKEQGSYLDSTKMQLKQTLAVRNALLSSAVTIIKENQAQFVSQEAPWTFANVGPFIERSFSSVQSPSQMQVLSLEGRHPFIESIQVDWSSEKIILSLYSDVIQYKESLLKNDLKKWDNAEQFLFNDLAYVARATDEKILPLQNNYGIALSSLNGSKSFLAFRLSSIAEAKGVEVKNLLLSSWNPKHTDLQPSVFPILGYNDYVNLSADQKHLSLVIYSPVSQSRSPETGFRTNSIYLIAKGLTGLVKAAEEDPSSEESQLLMQDFQRLRILLSKAGYIGYEGSALSLNKEFSGDFIFECPDYFQTVLAASREAFYVKGTKRYAVLEFSDVEQRILTENRIDTQIHEDLLRWRDDYVAAQLNLKGASFFDVPKPTQSVLFSNLKLSTVKYFRGDERKILNWGLDLSGGKTVQIELRDSNNRQVTQEADIKQGINELYGRVNKMGVSEVSIRQEGHLITLDFPGSQNLSAADLVKASSMFFHVVNEKFSANNIALASHINKFLQEVWNEAVITNRKTAEDINRIAWKHLYGDSVDAEVLQPRSESGRVLYENGLRLTNPLQPDATSLFNDVYSKVTILRGEDYTSWQGQTHPLLFVFRNFALEGSNLENVQSSYDPSRGNFLAFGVKGSYTSKEGIRINPRDDFAAWTTPFSKEKIAGTANGQFSRNLGWRMAVILNGTIVSIPTLDSPLKNSAMITGSFSQREINQLEADLKAGSLSFSPKILSEKNVSPELGNKERSMGVLATVLALVLVIGVMIGYYRFGGLIASIAVIFNLLIMWATLQNIQATLTLSSLAGLILTVGMAVDANVLVFERVREEFAISGRITAAIHAGYKKAFSAILDSNITTIIAALILLQFDSGPIRGFAMTLIIGIVSSMFTALFATKFFFYSWVQNAKNKSLIMMNWFKKVQTFDFLRYTKTAMLTSSIVILLGGGLFIAERNSLFGMDFTGGYTLNVELSPMKDLSYRQAVESALIKAGAKPQEIQVRELSPQNHVKIFLSKALDLPGRPLSGFVAPSGLETSTNPKIDWVLSSLQQNKVSLSDQAAVLASQNWSEVSGQMSKSMRNSALIGLFIALVCIFVYIALRFEFTYAMSATICLLHDIFFTLATVAVLHAIGVPVQIDLTTIAALMTIAGYSLNDTIIVFDRIREETKGMKKQGLAGIVNHALNITLSRTILTSGTTLLVLLPLIAMGGSTIFGFTLVMAIGVIFGTLSSLFIAAPMLLFFHKKEEAKQRKAIMNH